ncbi:MAG TPA: hypothetical protein VNB22_12530 [Pyrinomonadaceae bacterium]|nr:hypothetical protein [Pyrinomonadaceae bacterium]
MNKIFKYAITSVLCGLLLFTGAAQANPDCSKLSGTGQTAAVAPGVFEGTAAVKINGQTQNAAVTTYLLGAPTTAEDGTLKATTSHTFVFADGSSLTTLDRAVLSPTETPGLYNLNTQATITGGTGIYANACGSLNIHGTINLITGQVDWRFTGRICDCG